MNPLRFTPLAACVFLSLMELSACTDPQTATRLSEEIDRARRSIADAETDMKRFGDGSALYALAALRLGVLRQTEAMLEQKRDAAWFYPKLWYTVDGKAYSPPADVAQVIKALESELQSARDQWKSAQGKAEGAGGLLGVLALMEAQTKGLLVAQIEYQLTAYRNGFPPLMARIEPNALGGTSGAASAGLSAATESRQLAIPSEPSQEAKEREAMKSALSFALASKTYLPSDVHARRYQDYLLMNFEYENKTEREIRAFTGTVVFADIFDRDFYRVALTVDKTIGPGNKLREDGRTLEMNQFDAMHQRLISTEIGNLHVRFEPDSILFADGTRLGHVVGAPSN